MFTKQMLDEMANDGAGNSGSLRWNLVYLLGDIANSLERIADHLEGES
jgi:hypothetical protein